MKKIITLEMRIKEGMSVPRFYGVAWVDHCGLEIVCYPIPFHWIVRIVTHLWMMFKYSYRTRYENELIKVRSEGFRAGIEAGKKQMKRQIELQFESAYGRKL